MAPILVLYYSRNGATKKLANKIAVGVEQAGGTAMLRTVPTVTTKLNESDIDIPSSGDPFVAKQDLLDCGGLALGSPTRFGNMASSMKHFWDSTTPEWLSGALQDKPACVFTSTGSMHGGQESTLLSMMLPLFHHGMVIHGIPYSEPELHSTLSGGTPYGASHVAMKTDDGSLSEEEHKLCIAIGKRLATLSRKLGN